MALALLNPIPQFQDLDGSPLDEGSLYFGVAGQNPFTAAVTVYWDSAATIPAAQPVRTLNGYPMRNGSPAVVYASVDVSTLVLNKRGQQVYYMASSADASNSAALQAQITALTTLLVAKTTLLQGSGAIGHNQSLNYVAGTLGRALRDRIWCVTDYPWLATGDGTTDDYAAIVAAQTALAAAGGGTLLLPEGSFRILTAIPRVANVDYMGLGWSSILKPDNCSAFTYAFTTGFGNGRLESFAIEGVNCSAQIAIYQAGTLNDADELYGQTFRDLAIRGFNVGMQFRTTRNFTVDNCWIQDVNSGIKLIGKNLVWNIVNNTKIVKAAGAGVGTQYGVLVDGFNYTGGSGFVRPESVKIRDAHIYGFEYGVSFAGVVYGFLEGTDINATVEAVNWSSASALLRIAGNYLQIAGTSGSVAARGKDQSAPINTKIVIVDNHLNAVGTAAGTSIGVMLGTVAGAGNQDNVTVRDNSFAGFTLYDIACYQSGVVRIRDNECYSSGGTGSIRVQTVPTNRTVWVDGNRCQKTIDYDGSDFDSGDLRLGVNLINVSTVSDQIVSTVASAASINLPLGSRTFSITGTTGITSIGVTGWTGKAVQLLFSGILTVTDGGNLKLNGNFTTSADDTLTLLCDGTNWYEIARSAN